MGRRYGKLVRDKIPSIIVANGETPKVRALSEVEFLRALDAKMDEELKEYHETYPFSLGELADLTTVIFTAVEANGYTIDDLMQAIAAKGEKNGFFENRLWLEEVDDGC